MTKEKFAIGVDIGGGSIRASLIDNSGQELITNIKQTPQSGGNEEFLECLSAAIQPIITNNDIIGIGIGSPGPLNSDEGILIKSANLQTLNHVPIKSYLQQKFNIPIHYNNDANCAALGEAYFGSKKNTDSILALTLGTGVGGGYVENGKLFSGFQGNALEIGHTTVVINGALCGCGQKGCVESYFSTRGFINRYYEKTNIQLTDARDFFNKVEAEDINAVSILSFGITCLAHAVRNAIHILNPASVVFVGGITSAYHLFGETLEKEIRNLIFPILENRLVIGKGSSLAGTLGAACLVFSAEKE
ncbi:ROK family protein [Leptospira sp. 96542]|nr:ROK family protein [Leptospira sp. 96542]